MRNLKFYYSAEIRNFYRQSNDEILGIVYSNDSHSDIKLLQGNTWKKEIEILKEQLCDFFEGRIIFEYVIPRMGKRVDVVFLHNNIVFLLEFKCGEKEYKHEALNQVCDYALDLQNFQKESHDKIIVPILVATEAKTIKNNYILTNNILEPLKCNSGNIGENIEEVCNKFQADSFSYEDWENSEYLPTPTIVEAAQALYRGHNVADITRSDADAHNLSTTTTAVNKVIEYSKKNLKKSICFVTGVPGAGKTLVGLNIAIDRSDAVKGEHAVFLSGNYPLVTVLQEALARDKIRHFNEQSQKMRKTDALRNTSAFIQIIHKYRDSFVGNNNVPPEKVAIFDEAQRAWTHAQIAGFMRTKKGIQEFNYSEPEFLIQTMDRHEDWAVVVCLVGGGQEINTGEAGLPEWFNALKRRFNDWEVFVSPTLNDSEYLREYVWKDLISGLKIHEMQELHLATSVRSFRTPYLASFVKAVLDVDITAAKKFYGEIKDKYPIFLTRNLEEAKNWIKTKCRGTTRYGLIASSGALRLKPDGIFVKNEISVANWFLNDKDDIRSSYYMEDVVTEFDIQGLELDYSLIAWDADFRFNGSEWEYHKFSGNSWKNINSYDDRLYLKNAYRVLLTRARQGMALFIPEGDDNDHTRQKKFYDETYKLLSEIINS